MTSVCTGASRSSASPKPAVPRSSSLKLARAIVAESNAPARAPAPKVALRIPKTSGPASRVSPASTGSSTLKLNANVLTAADEHEHDAHPPRAARVANRLPRPGEDRRPRAVPLERHEVVDVHRCQCDEHCKEAHGVGGEAEARPEGGDDHSADCRPDDARRVEERGVERDRVRELGWPDHLIRERLPRGCVEHEHDASQHGEHVHLPWLDVAEQREQGQERRHDHRGRLRRHHQPARVEPVGEHAGEQAEDAEREELAEDEDADGDRRSGQLEHEPGHRDVLHPRARDRDRSGRRRRAGSCGA